jgi:D-alanyl-lipoteichoic acid acyltransferase DltB (MBOAT superfamily)
MLFNSIEFVIFFFIVFAIYWLLNKTLKIQNLFLLVASYLFYGWWDWRFLSLIILSSIIDYTAGLKIHSAQSRQHRKTWLYVSLVANLGLLSVFKYYNFFADSFSNLMNVFGWQPNDLTLNIILPVGISFYTFQTLSYTIDIYRREFQPTKNVISFFTYIAFFPQLVAGPIERAVNLLPQIERRRVFTKEYFSAGVVQILVGLFRKIVIADTLGAYVDSIYGNLEIHNATSIVLATILYAFQIYFDFAGYSDIAIGTAKLLGFKFHRNFNLPYFSKSLTIFWRKWHMSLSFWLRDYLYISLGGNRKGIKITYRNLMLTMLLGGLWHGSSWNFVIWGGIHGMVLSIEKYLNSKKLLLTLRKIDWLGYGVTFSIVLISWIFFRAKTTSSALIAVKKIVVLDFHAPFIGDINVLISSIFVLMLGLLFDIFLHQKNIFLEELGQNLKPLQIAIFATIIILLVNLFYSTSQNFIYFQF